MENYEAVLQYFQNADKPVGASQIAKDTGIDKKEVDKIMTRLKKEGTITSPKACFWEIKR